MGILRLSFTVHRRLLTVSAGRLIVSRQLSRPSRTRGIAMLRTGRNLPLRRAGLALAFFAFALLLAGTSDRASAWSIDTCREEWNKSPASNSCETPHNIWWAWNVQRCEFDVYCRNSSGTRIWNNDAQASPDWVKWLKNCNGVLSFGC